MLIGGVARAIGAMFFKVLFLPRRMHAGFDQGVQSTFVNLVRLSLLILALIIGYAVLVANGYLS